MTKKDGNISQFILMGKLQQYIETYEDPIALERMNKEIQTPENILNFNVWDLEYIFLQSDSEIGQFIKDISASKKFNKEDLILLRSKIKTSDSSAFSNPTSCWE